MRVLLHTVLGAEVILESYAEVYSNQFTTGNSPFQLVQWSTVPNDKNKNQHMIPFPYNQKIITARPPLSRVNVTELLRRLLVKIENIYLFKITIIIKNMETSLKTGFAQIFSRCPKNVSCPKFGGAVANSIRLRIYRLTSSTMIRVIWDHRSWSGSSHRKCSPFCSAYAWVIFVISLILS